MNFYSHMSFRNHWSNAQWDLHNRKQNASFHKDSIKEGAASK